MTETELRAAYEAAIHTLSLAQDALEQAEVEYARAGDALMAFYDAEEATR